MQPIAKDDFNVLYDHGRHLLRGKYRSHTDRILDEIKFFGNQFDEDPMNREFRASVERLFHDLGNDESGSMAWKPHLLKDVTSVILPEFLEKLYYLPIPRMEYSDPRFDIIVENLIVESDNLAPNILELRHVFQTLLSFLTGVARTTTLSGHARRALRTGIRIRSCSQLLASRWI
jgi:hypothetical protein